MTRRPARAAAALVLGLAATSLLTAAPAAAETSLGLPTEVVVVVPITVPASSTGLLDAEQLEDYTSEFGLLTRALDQVANRPVTLAIDPMIIASIRLLGTQAPASATEWLARLERATNDTFALGWADTNLALGLEAGNPVVIAPQSLDFAIDPSRFGPAAVEPTATPTPEPTATEDPDPTTPPPLPTTESLLAWDYALPSVAWPATDSVTAATFAELAAGFDLTLLASSNVARTGGLSAAIDINGTPALVADSSLSTLFSTTVRANPGSDWDAALASLDIALTTAATAPAASSAILTLDRTVSVTDSDLGRTIDAIGANPSVELVGLEAVADNTGPAATIVDKPLPAATVENARALLEQEDLDGQFVRIAEDPTLITSERRLALLATLGNEWTLDPTGWQEAVTAFEDDSTALRASVKIIKSSSITLWADRGSLPVIVENTLDQPVTVYITVRPLTPILKVENNLVKVTVEPNSQRKAQIPVQSISNGVVELDISLHGPNTQQIGYTTYVKTTVQAGWETPFTIVVAVIVVLIFIIGIIRTVRRRRRPSDVPVIGAK